MKKFVLRMLDADTGSTGGTEPGDVLGIEEEPKKQEEPKDVEFDVDLFNKMLNTTEGKTAMQRQMQSQIDKGVESAIKKREEEIKREAIIESQNKTPEQIEMAKLQKQVAELEAKNLIEANKNLVITQINSMGLSEDTRPYVEDIVLNYMVDDNKERTLNKLTTVTQMVAKITEDANRKAKREKFAQYEQATQNTQPTGVQQNVSRETMANNILGDVMKDFI